MAAKLRLQRPTVLERQPSCSLLSLCIGGKGVAPCQFDNCASVSTLSNGNLAVSDTNNNRIQIITPDGELMAIVGNKRLSGPWGVTSLPFGKFCVSEGPKQRIIVYADDGNFVSKFKVPGVEEPCAVAVCPVTGNIVVADYHNPHIHVYDLEGSLVTSFETETDLFSGDQPTAEHIAVDRTGNIFLSFGSGYSEMQVFNKQGKFQFKFGNFTSACGVHITAKNNVLIAEREQRSVSLYSTSGQFIQQLVTQTAGMNAYPHALTVVKGDTVVVTASDDLYSCPTWLLFFKLG